MSGPRDELRSTGSLGPAGIELLYRTVRQVVRTRNLPPPPHESSWTATALDGAAHEVFLGRPNGQRGEARLLMLATTSHSEEEFRSKLWTLVSNDLTSAGRRTERGRIAERLKDICAEMEEVSITNGVVTRAGHSSDDGDFDKLMVALNTVPVVVPAWDELSERAAPTTDKASLRALTSAALDIAGVLPFSTLVDAVAMRLQIQDVPDLMEVDELDHRSPLPDVERATAVDEAARVFLSQLTDAQRRVVPYLGESATEVAARTGLKRTRAWQCLRDVQAVIRQGPRDQDTAPILKRAAEMVIEV
jgi:hypothetical protein